MTGPGEPWDKPLRVMQLDLIPEPRDRLLALACVSIEDAESWRARGWLSFDVRDMPQLHEGQVVELCFVRNIARSGLSEVQISALLGRLARPYAYDPTRTAFSFAHGWVACPPRPTAKERDDFIRQHLKNWIEERAAGGEHDLLRRYSGQIIVAVARFGKADDMEDDE